MLSIATRKCDTPALSQVHSVTLELCRTHPLRHICYAAQHACDTQSVPKTAAAVPSSAFLAPKQAAQAPFMADTVPKMALFFEVIFETKSNKNR